MAVADGGWDDGGWDDGTDDAATDDCIVGADDEPSGNTDGGAMAAVGGGWLLAGEPLDQVGTLDSLGALGTLDGTEGAPTAAASAIAIACGPFSCRSRHWSRVLLLSPTPMANTQTLFEPCRNGTVSEKPC